MFLYIICSYTQAIGVLLELGLTAEFPDLGIPMELAEFCSVIPWKMAYSG